MKVIGIDMGHCLSGPDSSASARLSIDGRYVNVVESVRDREIGKRLINKLERNNYKVVNCTVDSASSLDSSLRRRVQIANQNNVDLFVSIHLNSGGGTGTEVWISGRGGQAERYATNVCRELKNLGYVDRGVKERGFYVLKYTNAPSILVECSFVDSIKDYYLYDPEKIAEAIYKGITGSSSGVSSGGGSSSNNPDRGLLGTVTASVLNVRDANGNKIGELTKGSKVGIDPEYSKKDWYSIFYGANGGLVSMDYVSVDNDPYFVVTKDLPFTDDNYKAINLEYVLPYFKGWKCYSRSYDDNRMWIETQYLTDEEESRIKERLGNLYYKTIYDGDNKYIQTDYLPSAYEGYDGVDLTKMLEYFEGKRCYLRSFHPYIWFETQYKSLRECIELKEELGSWFYGVSK